MGSPVREIGRDGDEGPVHSVKVDAALAVGVSHVTRADFARFAAATNFQATGGCNMFSASRWELDAGKSWRDPGFAQTERDPVVCVSWQDAKAYAAWLAQETGRDYRLLSEAEWEYAARGGTTTARWWGDAAAGQCQYANGADQTARQQFTGWTVADCEDGFINTSPAGTFAANPFGLFDMQGNAWQWVEDCGTFDYEGAPTDAAITKAASADCTKRALRGGSWGSFPRTLRVALRGRLDAATRVNVLGFRVARPE
ncbi:MAG: formylglycine-generating enzyme family protein, partial [Alphaproteobacteria bacterium]|nr:formylglycine-generating enzyme family protein [Alphaproteobacteria bacterium]